MNEAECVCFVCASLADLFCISVFQSFFFHVVEASCLLVQQVAICRRIILLLTTQESLSLGVLKLSIELLHPNLPIGTRAQLKGKNKESLLLRAIAKQRERERERER